MEKTAENLKKLINEKYGSISAFAAKYFETVIDPAGDKEEKAQEKFLAKFYKELQRKSADRREDGLSKYFEFLENPKAFPGTIRSRHVSYKESELSLKEINQIENISKKLEIELEIKRRRKGKT